MIIMQAEKEKEVERLVSTTGQLVEAKWRIGRIFSEELRMTPATAYTKTLLASGLSMKRVRYYSRNSAGYRELKQ
jgi:hypothetical protein